MSYNANVMINRLHITARRVPDLAVAVDHLSILTAIKQQICHNWQNPDDPEEFKQHTRAAIAGAECKDLSLTYSVTLQKSFWIGRKVRLYTPTTTCSEVALSAWTAFYENEQSLPCKSMVGKPRDLLSRYSP